MSGDVDEMWYWAWSLRKDQDLLYSCRASEVADSFYLIPKFSIIFTSNYYFVICLNYKINPDMKPYQKWDEHIKCVYRGQILIPNYKRM